MKETIFEVKFKDKTIPAFYVKDRAFAKQVVAKLQTYDCLFGLDTETEALSVYKPIETAALSPHLGKIRLLQIYNGVSAVVFDMKFIDDYSFFIPFLESKRFVAHNALFDMQFLLKAGVKHINIGCTYILFKLIIHAARAEDAGTKASLEALAQGLLSVPILKKAQTSDWSIPDLTFEQIEYSALDAVIVRELADKLAQGAIAHKLQEYYHLCKAAQYPIARMQLNGIGLNVERHIEMIAVWRQELYQAKKELLASTGLHDITAHTIAKFLENTLDKVTLSLWPKTPEGKLKTDSHTFAEFGYLKHLQPFSTFQRLEKLTTSFGMNLVQQLNPATQRLHPHFNIAGTRTGRLSCSEPNCQQLPRDKNVRTNFIPTKGKVFVCADYSQIELRVAAELSQDAEMLAAYRNGIDLHALTASKVSGKPLKEVTKEERQMAKALNFGLLFGLGAKKFSHYAKKSYNIEISDSEASEAVKVFRETYSGYRKWQIEAAEQAAMTCRVKTPCGKVRKLDPENTYGTSMNTPVQGGAAECMLHALVILQNRIEKENLDIKLCNVVHDEIILECSPDIADKAKFLLELSMTEGFLKVFPHGCTHQLTAAHIGDTWSEAKE